MKLHRRLVDQQGRSVAEFPVGQVEGVADDREAGLPEMDADLIGSTCFRDRLQQGGPVTATMEDLKGSHRLMSWFRRVRRNDRPGSQWSGLIADGDLAIPTIFCRMSRNSCQVNFLDRSVAELLLQISGSRGTTRGDQQAAGIGVQAMHQSDFFRMVCMLHGCFERVFEVTTTGVNRQWRRFIED